MEEIRRTDIDKSNADMYKSFVFYASMRESIEALPRKQGDELLRVIMVYGTTGEILPCSKNVKSAFLSMKPNIDASHKKFEKRAAALEKQRNAEELADDNKMKERIESFIENEYKAKDAEQIISLARRDELKAYRMNNEKDDSSKSR